MNRSAEIRWTEMPSPIGTLVLCRTAAGLCGIEFGSWDERGEKLAALADKRLGGAAFVRDDGDSLLAETRRQLNEYFDGKRRAFDVPLDLRGTPFQLRVWKALTEIPFGATASYRDIAAAVGRPKAVRAVGGANNRNPVPIIVPCHRVVGADGSLVGYGGGLPIKRRLLALEKA